MPLVAPCPNCGSTLAIANTLLYCGECGRFVGRMKRLGESKLGDGIVGQLGAAEFAPSPLVLAANDSLRRAREFEQGKQFQEAAELYAYLGLAEDLRRMKSAMEAHGVGGRSFADE